MKTTMETINVFITFFSENSYKHTKSLGIALIIFLAFLFLRKFLAKRVLNIMLKITSKTKTDMDEKAVMGFQKPIRVLFVVLGIYFPLRYLGYDFHINIVFINKCLSSIIIILISWGLYNLTGEYSVLYEEMRDKFGLKVDKLLFPFVSKSLRVVIVAFAITIVLAEWDINIQMFVTGLGLGGLAISLAAKDAAANIIAGIVIIIEKPFSIGDWIATSEIEGTVEDISFRSTVIRKFGNELVTVPNSSLTTVPITNFSKRGKRRITFNLGLTYSTPKEKIETCVAKIKNMLEEHPDVHKETIFVTFDKFNDSSLDLFLYFFTKTTVWGEYLKVKEDINLKIMEILQQEGVSIAFPSTSIYFENKLLYENKDGILINTNNNKSIN
ncbi:Low conductance mechanosensitive channel YnaI [Clostridium tepidiprofundi DSM 19306]|uniref:Low conductance mechanosensitive channel YnaI n=1 Tax=Clostridium tepidiprofundi DSM 19306 TaxID=1121338 RepID=A0A151AV95_9CLOT|nr:mechanosensitive ion channel family protein [Clostridium tepidiprofundi]KYH31576.1 Low conductance mechanosensitive channel YnaI [Clostridium tepidiprofundi DSM 19306]